MKATGIVRRIDDLGRVVIPKEIRRTLRIREGDPLEIFTGNDGEVIFKKYSPIGELADFTNEYAEVLYKNCGLPIIITDRDHVVSAAGVQKREYIERRISTSLENIIEGRKSFCRDKNTQEDISPIEGIDRSAGLIYTIISAGDATGAVIMLDSEDEKTFPDEAQVKLVRTASMFLGKESGE